MTANFRTATVPYAERETADAPQAPPMRRADSVWPDRIVFPALLVSLLVIYGLLQNPYWVPAGDSELYTAAAQNMARGEGYTFNGQSIAIIPPGWTWVMSIVMRVSPYFLPLKLLTMSCMIASLAMAYWIVRRFVSPLQAAGIILLTAILSHVYQATYWLISESLFCLVSTAGLLVAMQIAEGRKQAWRVTLLLGLCAAAVSVRWAGVFGSMLVVAALLDGVWKPKLEARWIAAALVIVVTIGTFLAWRIGLKGTPEEVAASTDVVTGTGEDMGAAPIAETGAPMTNGEANQSAKHYQIFPTGSYADRFLNWGRWFSYLYWQPFRAIGATAATWIGWVLIALLAVLVVQATRAKRWIWLAAGAYTGVLAIGWTNVNARYYVPIAFLITLGMLLATDQLIQWSKAVALRRALLVLLALFIGSVAICNVALYSVEVAIARSDRFYQRYETGLNSSLIAACQYLATAKDAPRDRELAVSQVYVNLGRTRASPFGLRATVLLTGKTALTPRFKDAQAVPTGNTRGARSLRQWLRSKQIKYYLYQTPISPWRVWHFRTGWLEKQKTGQTSDKDTAGWQLYRVDDDKLIPIAIARKCDPVTRVPGAMTPARIVIPIVAGIGNALMAVPMVRQIKLNIPASRITILARITPMADVFRRLSEVDEVIVTGRGLGGVWRMIREARKRRADVYLVPFPSNRWQYSLLAATSAARQRVLHAYPVGYFRAIHFLPATRVPARRGVHDVEQNLTLLSALGIEADSVEAPKFAVSDEDRARVGALLPADQRPIIVHAGSAQTVLAQAKRWPAEKYGELIDQLKSCYGDRVILVEGPDEAGVADEIARHAKSPPKVIRLTGPLADAAALLERAELYVGSDSGLAHLAAAVGTPAVTLFAPADPDRVCPYGNRDRVVQTPTPCSPCMQYPWHTPYPKILCREPYCITQITVDAVMAKVKARG